MTHLDVIIKLIGPVFPAGDSTRDEERLNNLKVMCEVLDGLIRKVGEVSTCKNSPEHSVQRAGNYAAEFLHNNVSE